MAFFLGFSTLAMAQEETVAVETVAKSPAPSPKYALIELFTAQSCVFCQDADEILESLSNIQGVTTIACHVDYYPADTDPLANEYCTERQKDYLKSKGVKHIYTPHFVVDGQYFVEAKRIEIEKIIQKADREPITNLTIEAKDSPTYFVALPDMTDMLSADKPARVLLFGVNEPVKSSRGNFEMKNAASQYGLLTEWDGAPKDIQFDLANDKDMERLVVMVQAKDLRILATGEKMLNEAQTTLENPYEDIVNPPVSDEVKRSEGLPVPEGSEPTE